MSSFPASVRSLPATAVVFSFVFVPLSFHSTLSLIHIKRADLQAFFDLDLTVENFEDDWDSSGGNKLLQNEVARDWWVLPRVGTQLELHFLRRIGMPPGEGCYIINDESFGRVRERYSWQILSLSFLVLFLHTSSKNNINYYV